MTAHELAKKLLDMPDVEVVYEDQHYGDLSVLYVEEGFYDDEHEPVIRVGFK